MDGATRHPRRRAARRTSAAHAALAFCARSRRAPDVAQEVSYRVHHQPRHSPQRRRCHRRLLRAVLRIWNALMRKWGTPILIAIWSAILLSAGFAFWKLWKASRDMRNQNAAAPAGSPEPAHHAN